MIRGIGLMGGRQARQADRPWRGRPTGRGGRSKGTGRHFPISTYINH
jgi:hypothetical protein